MIVNGWKGIDWKFNCIIILLLCSAQMGFGQRVIKGHFVDESSRKVIPQATLSNDTLHWGTSANNEGYFSISLPRGENEVWAEGRALGYETKKIKLSAQQTEVTISLTPAEKQLESVEVHRKRKYSNKNNPAVDLIRQVIQHKKDNKLHTKQQIQYTEYEKLQVGLLVSPPKKKKRKSSLDFFFDNADTTANPENAPLPIFLKENNAHIFSQKDPQRYKKIINQQKETLFDPRYINNQNIQAFIEDIFQSIDVYDESIYILQKMFLSPVADNAPLFYKFFIQDTVDIEGQSYISLSFRPRNETDLLLFGTLQISTDGRYAVKHADLEIGENANVNFIQNARMRIDYSSNEKGIMLPRETHANATFGIGKSNLFFGDRTTVLSDYDLTSEIEPQVFSGPPVEVAEEATLKGENFKRPIPLTETEEKTYSNVDSLNNMSSFQTLLGAGYLLAQGYYPIHYFEIGPLEYLYSRNNIEGNRIRIGGRSTAKLSEKVYIEGYTAYGFRDDAWKYNLKTAVSLNGKNIAQFPAHYLEGSVQKDIFEPGKNLGFLTGDSFFQSFRKNRPTKWIDTEGYQLKHVWEFGNHFGLHSSFTHQRRYPIGDLKFIKSDGSNQSLTHMHTNDMEFTLRWAPHEKFYYRNLNRTSIVNKNPVMALTYKKGVDGFWESDYAYDKLSFAIGNRFFMNQLGFFDIAAEAGKYWGTLPYPLLEIPNYAEEKERYAVSYNLLNSMEFIADQYVKIGAEHQLGGFILNKIPLIKKLKLREFWGFNGFAGSLSAQNDPALSPHVVEFERNEEGDFITRKLGEDTYFEGFVGLDNIFKVLRVEYVKRFNYLHSPEIHKEKVRLSLHIQF